MLHIIIIYVYSSVFVTHEFSLLTFFCQLILNKHIFFPEELII